MPQLVFGGAFNPIHHGHLICSRAVAESRGFDRILLVPTAVPPHKLGEPLAAAADRLEMCRRAVEGSELFSVSDIELRRDGPSYTLDTVRELSRQSGSRVHWLIGADMLMFLPHWHRPDELIREAELIVIGRPGWTIDWDSLPAAFHVLKKNVVEAPLIDIRASEMRRRVQAGLDIDFLTAAPVCQFIREKGLYRDG